MKRIPLLDLHVWGDPRVIAHRLGPRTRFLAAVGPADIRQWKKVARQPLPPTCLGFHLEGPYLNPTMAGALERRTIKTRVRLRELATLIDAAGGRVKMMTLAPELPGAIEGIRWLRRRGVVVSLGHTDATYAQAKRAIDAGATSVTHLFNRMRPLHHREPGVIGAALEDPRVRVQIILDGVHVHPALFRPVLRAVGPRRMLLTTDSRRSDAATNGLRLHGGAYYTKTGMLAGSALTLPLAIRHAVEWGGLSPAQARAMASTQPARLLGIL